MILNTRPAVITLILFLAVLVSYLLFLHAGRGGGAVGNPSVMLQSHDEDLHSLLHQLLPVV